VTLLGKGPGEGRGALQARSPEPGQRGHNLQSVTSSKVEFRIDILCPGIIHQFCQIESQPQSVRMQRRGPVGTNKVLYSQEASIPLSKRCKVTSFLSQMVPVRLSELFPAYATTISIVQEQHNRQVMGDGPKRLS
jgi:hypothetical protein